MDPYLIGNALLGIFLFVSTVATILSTRMRATMRAYRRIRAREELWEEHVYDLRRALARHGIARPDAPAGLFDRAYEEEES